MTTPTETTRTAARLRLSRALQRRESSTAALLAMYGSTNFLVVPQAAFAVHAAADREVRSARAALMAVEYAWRCSAKGVQV